MARVDELGLALQSRLAEIALTFRGENDGGPHGALAVAAYDYLSDVAWSFGGARWFHAASIIKVAILAAVFEAIDAGRFGPDNRLHVRNRFLSALDAQPFRVQASRDADSDVHAAIGRTMRIGELARHMIVTSSNLATNLLLDAVGVETARQTLERRGIAGIDLRRGVEDDRAFEADCNNRVTADGCVGLLRAIHDGHGFSPESSRAMLTILFDQRFAGGIRPGLPEPIRGVARVAHKTGDISSVSHDAGIVFLPGRPPYVVAILSESTGDAALRTAALAATSRAVYEAVAAAGEAACR